MLSLFINIGTQVGWNIIRPGTSIFLKGLQKLTGSKLIEEMADFFTLIDPILKAARQDPERANALLNDPSTAFMVVSGAQQSQLDDAKVFESRLRHMAIKVEALVVNRVLPLHLNDDVHLPATDASDDPLTLAIIQWGIRLENVARNQIKLIENVASEADIDYVRIHQFEQDVHSLEGIRRMVGALGAT